MSRAYILPFISLAFSSASAQVFMDTSGTWNELFCVMGSCLTSTYMFSGDTMFNGITYSNMVRVDGPYQYPHAAMREDGLGRVYVATGDVETLLYDFTLAVGDTFPGTDAEGCPLPWVVTQRDTVLLLDGEARPRLHLSPTWSPDVEMTWTQGFGSSYGPAYLNFIQCGADFSMGLLCFWRNDTMLYQSPALATCEYSTAGIADLGGKIDASVWPQPVVTSALVEVHGLHGPTQWVLCDVFGRPLLTLAIPSGGQVEFQRNTLPSGFYIYQVLSEGRSVAIGKLMLE